MSFQTFLDRMREKPEHIRRRTAFWGSFSVTVLVTAIWLASFTSLGQSAKSQVADVVNKAGTPVQSLVANIGSIFGEIRNELFGPKKINYSSVTVKPGNR